ncbi:MAG TPA: hypothetical protein VNS09_24280 [Solirubrobacter sp.]|nr:hypothetical protein [Solirubrobacter sp.]
MTRRLLLAALLAGCGGAAEPAPEVAERTPRPRVEIAAPVNGAAVPAAKASGSTLRGHVRVQGRAAAAAGVTVTTGCGADCEVNTSANAAGAFATEVAFVVDADDPRLTIAATYPGDPETAGDRVIATVRAPSRATKPKPRRTPKPKRAPAPPNPTATPGPRSLLLIGDSLAEGIAQALPQALPGWRVAVDARTGRPLAEGMRVLAARGALAPGTVLAISLFTNDDPGALDALEAAVRETAAAASCVLWATIVRPPVGGRGYADANARLERLAAHGGRLVLVPWADAVRQHPEWIGGDGVHATPAGYRARADLYAAAARACPA